MKIAVTYSNGEVFQHFGHTEELKIYDVEGKKVIASEVVKATEGGHSAIVELLLKNKVEVLICGGIGGGAKNALAENNIKLMGGVSGNADTAVADYLQEKLQFNPNVSCNHFDDHHCGEEHHHCHGADGCSHKN